MAGRMIGKGDIQQQRLSLLESILLWEGRLNNARLRELFGLSSVRASEWIREFREQHPSWTAWDSKTRSYHATQKVYRVGRNADLRRQGDAVSLSQYIALVGISHTVTEASLNRTIWAAFPELSAPSPKIFALLSEAIRAHRALQITYRSMREPSPHQRIISPHSLIRAGRRWHVRAFCSTHQDFRDYALGRIESGNLLDIPSERHDQDDTAWTTKVRVRLVAHPELTPEQDSLIRFEYFNNTAARVDSVFDWLDAVRTINSCQIDTASQAISLPIREASARLFNDSKRIEKLTGPIDVLLANSTETEIREPFAVWQELGLFREEHPVRLAGDVLVERERVTARLDTPYMGLPADTVRRLASVPELVMTIENLTTFHSEARRRCNESALLIYTAGMPSPAWRAMYARLLMELPASVPVFHWGDIDEGGFRIAATLAQDALAVGYAVQPWSMHPDDVPADLRRKATPRTLERIRHFAKAAGWSTLGEVVAEAGFTVEQEGLA